MYKIDYDEYWIEVIERDNEIVSPLTEHKYHELEEYTIMGLQELANEGNERAIEDLANTDYRSVLSEGDYIVGHLAEALIIANHEKEGGLVDYRESDDDPIMLGANYAELTGFLYDQSFDLDFRVEVVAEYLALNHFFIITPSDVPDGTNELRVLVYVDDIVVWDMVD